MADKLLIARCMSADIDTTLAQLNDYTLLISIDGGKLYTKINGAKHELTLGSNTGGGALTPEDQAKLNFITITAGLNLDTLNQDLIATGDRTKGLARDTTDSWTTSADDIILDNVQNPVTDLTNQGQELASTQRVEDMIDTHFSTGTANDMESFSGLDSINFNDSWIDPTQSEANAIKLIAVSATAVAKTHLWEVLINVTIAASPNLEKVFGSEGLLFLTPVEGDYHRIEFYNHDKNKLGLGLLDTKDDNYVPIEYLATENDVVGVTHYEGLPSIDIPSDILFAGKTPQEVMTTLVTASTAKHGSNRWSYAMEINVTETSTLHGIFGNGYIWISYVGNGHHEAKFYSDDEKMYLSTYDANDIVRVDYQQIQFVGEFNYQIIEEDIAGNTPTRQECTLAYEKVIGYDWTKRMEFRLKSTAKDKYFSIDYLGESTSTQLNPGNFRIFASTLA